MTTATITRTKEYLVIKIPLPKTEGGRHVSVALDTEDEMAIREGLQDIANGRISRSFRTAKEAITHLRSL